MLPITGTNPAYGVYGLGRTTAHHTDESSAVTHEYARKHNTTHPRGVRSNGSRGGQVSV
jgi:hypothetical protein